MGIKISQLRQFEVIPTGEYIATIKTVEQVEGKFPNERTGKIEDQLQWKLNVITPAGEKEIRAWTSLSFGPKSKLFRMAQAAFANPIPATYNLDTDDLLGRKVKLVIVVKVKEDGTEFSKIEDYKTASGAPMPAKPVSKPVEQPAQQHAQADAYDPTIPF